MPLPTSQNSSQWIEDPGFLPYHIFAIPGDTTHLFVWWADNHARYAHLAKIRHDVPEQPPVSEADVGSVVQYNGNIIICDFT